ncbi:MAG: bifunctional phosphoribosyl-AMP cyclohydrolase/phosphoribosyl-ATP diphosphatase HisIE [Cyclobacteriaceae bacterium]|nr:bifunctional phosphoribosyl-AMP cyclohydrolase/phosphoribosyl-ATP diphosphatase HisIE [Cyclobacteriaceae bacterium]
MDITSIQFDKATGLVPGIVQDKDTGKVLMLGYLNQEALLKTLEDKRVTFYSRSKKRLWTKGETSRNYLEVDEILLDCDQDALLIKVHPLGPVCHTGTDTCFNESNSEFSLNKLEEVIRERINNPVEGSYTAKLLKEGINKIAQKVGEEAVELVIESKDENKERLLNEAADLMYHYLLLLAAKDSSLKEVVNVLQQRHEKSKS